MRRRILLADDSVTIQKVIELTFMDEDYDVKAVSNGDEATAALSQITPDFVIADVHMPGANGYEVCRRSKELRAEVPVLLLVGTFEPFDEGQARAVGADSFLKKPFDSQELLQRVQEMIAAREPAPPVAPLPLSVSEEPWSGFELQAEPEPEPAAPFAPEPFRFEEERPAAPAERSPFLEEESPFVLEEDRSYQAEPELPAGEPMFDLDAPAPVSLDEPEPALNSIDLDGTTPGRPAAGFDPWAPVVQETTPEERLGVPQDAVPLVDSLEETEARIEAPPPPSTEASHEPAAAWRPPTELTEPEPAPPIPAPAESAFPANGGGRLSDEDVDRIARRVVELMGDKAVRDIAWEVIPDLAEVVIRDRLRELASQAESLSE